MSNHSKVNENAKVPSGTLPLRSETPCPPNKPVVTESSWGDRWKKAAYGTGVNFGMNYVVNTLFSVALAYAFERKCIDNLHQVSDFVGRKVAQFTKGDPTRTSRNFFMGTKGLTLTTGGTVLVPFQKLTQDHRQSLEFRIGHALDVLQNAVGLGNAATEENLREYKIIKSSLKSGNAPDVCIEDEERFRSQHHVGMQENGKFGFIEHKISWTKVLLARAAAWAAAFTTNTALEDVVGLKKRLNEMAPKVSKRISKRIPAFGRLADPNLFSANLMNDAILTVSSSVTQGVVQGALSKEKHVPQRIIPPNRPPIGPDTADEDPQWVKTAVTSPAPEITHVARVEKAKAANEDLYAQQYRA